MTDAHEFDRQINEIGVDGMRLSLSSIPEAKKALQQLRVGERAVRAINRSVNSEQRAIRSAYSEKKANAGSGGSTVLSLFGKRGAAGSYRAAAKRDVQSERDSILAPYDVVKQRADAIIDQIANAKSQIDLFILQIKEEDISQVTCDQAHCTKCGRSLSHNDNFCGNCGHKTQ